MTAPPTLRAALADTAALPVVLAWFLGQYLMTGRAFLWEGAAAVVALAGYAAVCLVVACAFLGLPALRRRNSLALAVQASLRDHRDPGPGVRERVDAAAQVWARTGWVAVVFPAAAVVTVAAGLLGRAGPSPVTGAVLCTVVGVLAWRWSRRRGAEGRRWLADRPGPPRDLPPASWRVRWLGGRRDVLVVATVVLVGVLLGLLVALLA